MPDPEPIDIEPNAAHEALAARFRADSRSGDGWPEGTIEALERCAKMLDTYAPDLYPANPLGQVDFARAMMESVADEIRAFVGSQVKREARVAELEAERDMLQRDLDAAIEVMARKPPPGMLAVVGAVVGAAGTEALAEMTAERDRLQADLETAHAEASALRSALLATDAGQSWSEAGPVCLACGKFYFGRPTCGTHACEQRRLALAPDAGAVLLAELHALRRVAEAAREYRTRPGGPANVAFRAEAGMDLDDALDALPAAGKGDANV